MRAAILAILGATCQVLIFPPFGWTWLTWLALAPLFLIFPLSGPGVAAVTTFLFGTLATVGLVTPWLWPAARDFFGCAPPTASAVVLLVGLVAGGVPLAGLGVLLQSGSRLGPIARVLCAPAAWVGVEYLRAQLPFGTAWALLGSALAETPSAIQTADLGGVYMVSFLAALASAAVAEGILMTRDGVRRTAAAIAVAGALLVSAFVYGGYRRAEIQALMAAAPVARIAIVHADIPNTERVRPELAVANLERYLTLSPPAGAPLDLVVWPENAVPLLLEENPDLVASIAARCGNLSYLIGAPRVVESGGRPTLRASALLIGRAGIIARYDKRRLVPLAEIMPSLRGARVALPRGFTPGAGAPVLVAGELRLAPLICYEAIFPELARAAVRGGADLLVNLSNDSWFPLGAGPRQHYLLSRLRAVEMRRTLIRAANRGVTAIVLPDGATPVATDGRTAGLEIAAVPRLTLATLYARIGDAFAWMCLGGAIAGLAVERARRSHRS